MPKTILITGCSTGLGAQLAVSAAQQGYKVFATMRDADRRAHLDQLAKAAGVQVHVRRLDVRDAASIAAVVDEIVRHDGGVDVLINNAGVGFVRSTEQATEAEIAAILDVNLMGVIRCTKAVLPHMRERRAGRVVTVSSVGGLVGQPFNEIYCAAKFGVEGFMESLACYVGPAFGLHFTVIEPGGIQSEFAANVLKHVEESGGMRDDAYLPILQKYMGTVQSRQWETSPYQTAVEVADVVMACLVQASPPVRMRTSPWAENLCQLKTQADPAGLRMRAMVAHTFLGEDIG